MTHRYAVRAHAAALRAVRRDLDEDAALALVAFLHGALSAHPRSAGRPLDRALDGLWAAERSDCTVLYVIDDERRTVTVTSIETRPGRGRLTPGR